MSVEGSPAQQSKTRKLARQARHLQPERPPWYVQHATPDTPLSGWWWQPAGAPAPQPLAASYDAALMTLATFDQTGVPA